MNRIKSILLATLITLLWQLSAQDDIQFYKNELKKTSSDTGKVRILKILTTAGADENGESYRDILYRFTEEKLKDNSLSDTVKRRMQYGLVLALDEIGFLEQQHGNGLKAIELWERILNMNKELKDDNIEGFTRVNIGYVNDRFGNIPKAIEYFHKSISCFEKTNQKEGLAAAFNNLASIYQRQKENKKALEFYEKALKLQEGSKDKRAKSYIMNNIAGIYYRKGDTIKAKTMWEECLQLNKEINNIVGIAHIYSRYAEIEKDRKDFNKAIMHYSNALELLEKANDKLGIARQLTALGFMNFEQKNYHKAIEFGEKGLLVAKQIKYAEEIINASYCLSNVYSKTKNFEKAFEMHVLFKRMSDSVNTEKSKQIALKKNFEYEFQKQAAQDSIKSAEEQKIFAAEIKHQKTQSTALYIGIGLIAIFSVFMYNRFRITQRQKVIIEKQKELVDEKQKEIIDSMHYAKRIQTALMPSEKNIRKKLDNLN